MARRLDGDDRDRHADTDRRRLARLVASRRRLRQLWPNLRLSAFIGLTSAVGSIGWFTAFALQNASYVRAVGQIEVVFTL